MEEKVERNGRLVTVTLGDVSCTRSYAREGSAKRAEHRLLMSKRARLDYFKRRPVDRRR